MNVNASAVRLQAWCTTWQVQPFTGADVSVHVCSSLSLPPRCSFIGKEGPISCSVPSTFQSSVCISSDPFPSEEPNIQASHPGITSLCVYLPGECRSKGLQFRAEKHFCAHCWGEDRRERCTGGVRRRLRRDTRQCFG